MEETVCIAETEKQQSSAMFSVSKAYDLKLVNTQILGISNFFAV